MTRIARWQPYLLIFLVCGGCASQQGARMQKDVNVFQRERSAERLVQRGAAFASVGDTTRAQQYLEAALDNGGREAEIIPMLITVCVRDGRYRLAIQYARRYLATQPGDSKMHFVLGTLHAGLNETEAAEREFELAARGERNNAELQYSLAVLLRDQKDDLLAADGHFREYLRLEPDGEHAEEARAGTLRVVR